MSVDLTTTNALLGIMAAVSVLEVLAVGGILLAAVLLYRRTLEVIRNIESRQVAPSLSRVNAILDDIKGVTTTVRHEAARVERLVECVLGMMGNRDAASTRRD